VNCTFMNSASGQLQTLYTCLNLQGLDGLKELVVETNQLVLERVGTIAQTDGCRKEHYHLKRKLNLRIRVRIFCKYRSCMTAFS
jgi:hypothetical protein